MHEHAPTDVAANPLGSARADPVWQRARATYIEPATMNPEAAFIQRIQAAYNRAGT